MPELTGSPLPLVRRLVGALLLVAPPLLVATSLRVRSSEFPVLATSCSAAHGAPTSAHVGPWAALRSLCDCSWALDHLSLYRSQSLSCSACLISWSPCCLLLLLLVGLRCRPCLARGRSSALWATARGCFAACSSAALGRSSAPYAFFRCCCGATCSRLRLRYGLSLGLWVLLCLLCANSWALRCRCGFGLGLWCPSALRLLLRSVCCLARLLCYLLLGLSWGSPVAYSWACGHSCAPCAASRGCCVALRSAAPPRSCAMRAVCLGCCAASCFAARWAPLLPMPGLVGAPLLLV